MAITYPLPWPIGLRPERIELSVASLSRSGGQSITGAEQIVVSPAARWEGSLTLPAMTALRLIEWRGFVAALQGRLGTFNMPIFDCGRQPFGGQGSIVVKAAAAAVNAQSLVLTVEQGAALLAGHRFSIAGRLHEIMQSVFAGSIVTPDNLLTQPFAFDHADWTKGGATVTANATLAPDGTLTADNLVESALSEQHFAHDSVTASTGVYSLVVYAKYAGRQFFGLQMDSGVSTNSVRAVFDLQTGLISTAASSTGTGSGAFATIKPVGNGWYRCLISGIPYTSGTTLRSGVAMTTGAAGYPTYLGDGVSGYYLWGARVAAGLAQLPDFYGTYNADIHPWLRAAIGGATPCEFANPTSLMRFATDAEGRLDLESGIIAHPKIAVVEAF